MKALLVIDMQVGLFLPETPRFDAAGVVQRINTLIKRFRNQGNKIIFIQHDGTKENFLLHGTADWKILPTLHQAENDIHIEKTANDSFYKTDLEKTLKTNDINNLYITGCATDFCVNSTVQTALVKDYNMTIVKDCHTTCDRPNFKAKELIDFHNWLWENLTPTQGRIQLKSLKELI